MTFSFIRQSFANALRIKLTLIFLVLFFQCSPKTDLDNVEIPSNRLLQNHNIQNFNLTKSNNTDVLKNKSDVEGWIKTTSMDFDLQNLKDKKLSSNEIEIRIWSGQETEAVLNCLILNKKAENWYANVYSSRVSEKGEFEKTRNGKNLVNKKTLSPPKSGWKNMSSYLVQKGIKIPLQYFWDTEEKPVLEDEGTVSLEIKEDDNYDLISYGEITETPDGKSVISICNYLENEFDVKIGCGSGI